MIAVVRAPWLITADIAIDLRRSMDPLGVACCTVFIPGNGNLNDCAFASNPSAAGIAAEMLIQRYLYIMPHIPYQLRCLEKGSTAANGQPGISELDLPGKTLVAVYKRSLCRAIGGSLRVLGVQVLRQ